MFCIVVLLLSHCAAVKPLCVWGTKWCVCVCDDSHCSPDWGSTSFSLRQKETSRTLQAFKQHKQTPVFSRSTNHLPRHTSCKTTSLSQSPLYNPTHTPIHPHPHTLPQRHTHTHRSLTTAVLVQECLSFDVTHISMRMRRNCYCLWCEQTTELLLSSDLFSLPPCSPWSHFCLQHFSYNQTQAQKQPHTGLDSFKHLSPGNTADPNTTKHNSAAASYMCHRRSVLYLGKIKYTLYSQRHDHWLNTMKQKYSTWENANLTWKIQKPYQDIRSVDENYSASSICPHNKMKSHFWRLGGSKILFYKYTVFLNPHCANTCIPFSRRVHYSSTCSKHPDNGCGYFQTLI